MPHQTPENPIQETEEIDVTTLIERIETLEKENLENKKAYDELEKRVIDCEDSIDALAGGTGASGND